MFFRKTHESAATVQGLGSRPQAVRLFGRGSNRDNLQICGEYQLAKEEHHGQPVYRLRGSDYAMRYAPSHMRWVIDRQGPEVCDTDMVAAYAHSTGVGPCICEDLIWHVFEASERRHVEDRDLVATTAPMTIQVMGRANGLENERVNGEYMLCGRRDGRVFYHKLGTAHVIRYWPPHNRWVIDLQADRPQCEGDVCHAWADAHDLVQHPGDARLTWHVWDSPSHQHIRDEALRSFCAPRRISLCGRHPRTENSFVNGSYELIGVQDGKPAYGNSATGIEIRHLPSHSRWVAGNSCSGDVCHAFANSCGTEHPGSLDLVWHLWEGSRGVHIVDQSVKSSTAPMMVEVYGRHPLEDNSEVNGTYRLLGMHEGRPAYIKEGSNGVIRYIQQEDRWLLDIEGLRAGSTANAFAEANGTEHPGVHELRWHVWETNEAGFVLDTDIACEVVETRQVALDRPPVPLADQLVPEKKKNARAALAMRPSNHQATASWFRGGA